MTYLKILGIIIGVLICLLSMVSFIISKEDKPRQKAIILGFIGFVIVRLILKYS